MDKLAIIGFGNQAKAWALNLRDSGFEIAVGLRPNSKSANLVKEMGFDTFDISKPCDFNDFAILVPDDAHKTCVELIYKTNKSSPCRFIYPHGFGLHYTQLAINTQNASHYLLAPKAIASELRFQFETGGSNGGVYDLSLGKEEDKAWLLNLGNKLGLNSLHQASIEDETKADLFSEQSLLCSTIPYAALFSFNKLREEGISPEVAYFECWYELKLIVDTLVKIGPVKFFNLISPNALIGSEIGKDLIFNEHYFEAINKLYNNIQSKNFLRNLEDTDIDKLREKIINRWQSEELSTLHDKLKEGLFN